ncbi:MAG TPA: hypothetical protein DDX71_05210 [Ruminococcus sp.]|nr:hypothetical protein [Ruminococcus sp.]
MKTHRIIGTAAALAVLCQSVLPVMPAAAAQSAGAADPEDFAAAVREIVQGDADRTIFQEITFDPAAGTLICDGTDAGTSCGDLIVRDGELMLKTKQTQKKSGISVQSIEPYAPFADAAAENGFTYTESDGILTVTNEFQTARLIVKAKGSIPRYGSPLRIAEGCYDLHILQYAAPADALAAYQQYSKDPAVQFVQPSHRVQLDPALSEAEVSDVQSGIYNTWGTDAIGSEDFIHTYLNAELLPDVTVAVIDTGINTQPALFDGRILENGINISDSGDDTVTDDMGHGTHVTGTICELTTPNVSILPVKTFDREGSSSDEQIYLGILYAIENGADILNMSFGGLGVSPLEVEAMAIADRSGVIACAAAGNNGDDAAYYYPGGIESCITVGAVDVRNQRAAFSNNGEMLDVSAPGVDVRSYTHIGEELGYKSGTSMATPHVAACCALLLSHDQSLTPDRVQALINCNAADLGAPGFDTEFGWGMVNLRDFQWDDGICRAPEYSRKSGNYGKPQTVELSTVTEDAVIYYTTDGSVPTAENGILYTAPIEITETTYLRAIACREGFQESVPSEAVYQIGGTDTADSLTIENGILTHYTGILKEVTVPAEADGKPVTGIAEGAFADNHFVTTVSLPDSVVSIGKDAFRRCTALESLRAKGVKEIGAGALADCTALTEFTHTARLTSLGASAFANCISLTELSLSGIRELPDSLCSGCVALETLSVPDAETFADKAFCDCSRLTEINCDWKKIRAIGEQAFAGCSRWNGDLLLSSIETLGSAAFYRCSSLMRLSLPETVTVLPDSLLMNCSGLRLLQLPGVTELQANALATHGTRDDLTVELNYSRLTAIGDGAFSGFRIGSRWETVTFASLREIGPRTFAGASANALEFPLLTEIPAAAFSEQGITMLSIPQAEKLGENSLTGCLAVHMTGKMQKIGSNALPDGIYVVTHDQIPALSAFGNCVLCDEPLIMGVNSKSAAVTQHRAMPLRVLAMGDALTYQWYMTDGDSRTAISGADTPCYTPDTAETGTQNLVCVITDAAGKTDEVPVQLNVQAETESPAPLLPDETVYPDAGSEICCQIVPEHSGSYRIAAEGNFPITGTLTDPSGQPLALLHNGSDGSSTLTAELVAGTRYLLTASGKWNGICSLILTQTASAPHDIADCNVTVRAAADTSYDHQYIPLVTVLSPEGKMLSKGKDYILRTYWHNQNCTVSIFGIGNYRGYTERTEQVCTRLPEDTPIPVSLESSADKAVFLFVPRSTGKYALYSTTAEGYAEELKNFYRTGSYPGGSHYVNINTKMYLSDTPDGSNVLCNASSYVLQSGYYFTLERELNAGQNYYLICSADRAAEYRVVASTTRKSLRNAKVTSEFIANYNPEQPDVQDVTVTLAGETLQEGIDYFRVDNGTDVPGTAAIAIIGTGLYTERTTQQYDILFQGAKGERINAEIGTPLTITCAANRLEQVWFTVDACATDRDTIRTRILNERISGTKLLYSLYRYNARTRLYTQIYPIDGEKDDYSLRNGTYCLTLCRQYPQQGTAGKITVLYPRSLPDAALEIGTAVYTGDDIAAPVTVTAADGTLLECDKDYTVNYPDGHTLFGETPFILRAGNTTYGNVNGTFRITVDLPADAPILPIGTNTANVTLENRLAVYRIAPETDTSYLLGTNEVANTVLRVFAPDGELLEQAYGNGAKSVRFNVPAGETRYVMIKFNGTARSGKIDFFLETTMKQLEACTVEAPPQFWTGERILPDVTFTDGDYTLVEGRDYQLRYTADDVQIGLATANYTGIGEYFGICDVEYPIIAPDLAGMNLEAIPLLTNRTFSAAMEDDEEYLLYKYTAGLTTPLHLDVFEAYCKLYVQRYDADGTYLDSMAVESANAMEFDMEAGETTYLLISATNISSWNRIFKLQLSDFDSSEYRLLPDEENGVTYRIFDALGYAEVFSLNTSCSKISLLPEIEGISVQNVPEGLFTKIPADTVIYGYEGCPAAAYANDYYFAYFQYERKTQTAGDLNRDGICSAADAVLLVCLMTELEAANADPELLQLADINGDSFIDLTDYSLLTQMMD